MQFGYLLGPDNDIADISALAETLGFAFVALLTYPWVVCVARLIPTRKERSDWRGGRATWADRRSA
jgi:hypothetical protein